MSMVNIDHLNERRKTAQVKLDKAQDAIAQAEALIELFQVDTLLTRADS